MKTKPNRRVWRMVWVGVGACDPMAHDRDQLGEWVLMLVPPQYAGQWVTR